MTVQPTPGVSTTFSVPCLVCGAVVRVVETVTQPHDCDPPDSSTELVARAFWNGYDLATGQEATS